MSFSPQKTACSKDIRKANQLRILHYLLQVEETSQSELSDKLEISWPTVQLIVKSLLKQGLVQENGPIASTGGRKPIAISLARNSRYFIGIDITKDHLGFVLLNLAGQCTARKKIVKDFSDTESWFTDLNQLLLGFLKKERVAQKKICGSGFSLPAIIDLKDPEIPFPNALNCRGLYYERFSRAVPWPITFINDSDAAGYAEFRNNKTIQNAVYLALNNSVGGSMMLNGAMYPGQNNRSGEFGHMIAVPNGKKCYCGNHGCLDAYCNARILTDHSNGDPDQFFALLKKGNAEIRKVWNQYLETLLFSINNLRMILDCDIILGGILGGYLYEYKMEIFEKLKTINPFRPDARFIQFCQYQQEASAQGAAMLALDTFFGNL
ncbi:MAG: ROK family transcriptional regulator [Planctomycetia bacterium]|nr:ROK family transcriptional regulator [Planctomycetia bacterium]